MARISRRALLCGGLAAGAYGALAPLRGSRAEAPWTEIAIDTRVIEVAGRPATVFGLMQPSGAHGLVMEAGRDFRVRLANRSAEKALIHWHGLTPPNALDGVPHVTQAPIAPGADFSYEFPVALPGTHWMHSHLGLQEQRLMAAPLIVRDPAEADLDEQEIVVMLHDFTFRDPEDIIAQLSKGMGHSAHAGHSMPSAGQAMPMNHDMMAMPDMPDMNMGAMDMGPGASMHDLNDVAYDAYLANDRTLADPEIVRVEKAGRVRLRIINAAASTNFTIDLGRLEGELIATDGRPIVPLRANRFPLAIAQRADIRLVLPEGGGAYPVLAQREGDVALTGLVLATKDAAIAKLPLAAPQATGPIDAAFSLRPVAAEPLAPRQPDRRFSIGLMGDMMSYAWGLGDLKNGAPRLEVAAGERVEIDLINRSMMSHPMHLHGHHFQIVGVGGAPVQGAMRDTVLVPIDGRVTIAFDAVNPGRWMFHCHNLYHMVRGMMTELVYV